MRQVSLLACDVVSFNPVKTVNVSFLKMKELEDAISDFKQLCIDLRMDLEIKACSNGMSSGHYSLPVLLDEVSEKSFSFSFGLFTKSILDQFFPVPNVIV